MKRPIQYETLKFNTPDGDLHKGQYAFFGGQYLVRKHPENNFQWSIIDPYEQPDYLSQIAGLTEVQVIPNEHCYYYEYVLQDGSERIVRFPIKAKDYEDGKKAGANVLEKEPKPTKDEIDKIKEKDNEWL